MPDETPQPNPANNSSALTKVLIGIIALLIVGVIALAYVFTTKDNNDNPALSTDSSQSENDSTGEQSSDQEPMEPHKTVSTDINNLDMELTSIHRNENFLTLNFEYVYTGTDSKTDNPSFFKKLSKAYMVEGTSDQKYEVVVDANGEPLVSDLEKDPTLNFDDTEDKSVRFFITITAPPAGSTVDIYVPGSQPVTGILIQ